MFETDLKNIESWFENENEITITMNDFKEFSYNKCLIEENGYSFKGNDGNLNYLFDGTKKLKLKIFEQAQTLETKMPDYENSMVNLASSLQKYYGKSSTYKSAKYLDDILKEKEYKHVFFLILDGLAPYILDNFLTSEDFLKKYKRRNISAVFPSTTACAIPASASGKLSVETGWLGWENYFEDINKDLVLFMGQDYKSGEKTGINVREKYLPYDDYFKSFEVKTYDLEPSFKPNGFEHFNGMCKKMIEISKEACKTFTYAYWDEPDGTLHMDGTDGEGSKNVIKNLSKDLDNIKDSLGEDSLIIITADHGHQNVKPIYLYEYEDLYRLLERTPSNESRSLCFKVKEGNHQKFVKLFNDYFSPIYDLYSKEDFIKKGFLSDINHRTINPYLDKFMGDYIAVAKSNYYFIYVKSNYIFKSTHAGLTKNEMETPFIVYSK